MYPLNNHVPPSGDKTGAADYAAISGAIATARGTGMLGTVSLSGDYYVNHGVVLGDAADAKVVSCNLRGEPFATINYVGPRTSEYALRVHGGSTQECVTRLSNLRLNCGGNRGILYHSQYYNKRMENICISNTRQIGLDLVDCWGGALCGVQLQYGYGLAVRVRSCYQMSIDNLRLSNCYAFWNDGTEADRIVMWDYELANGTVKTREKYATGPLRYTEAWPAVDDTSVIDWEGKPVQLPEKHRCLMYVQSRYNTFRNLIVEGCVSGGRPIIVVPVSMYDIEFDRMYMEANRAKDCTCWIDGGSQPAFANRNIRFRNVISSSKRGPNLFTDAFIRTTGFTSDVIVDGLSIQELRDSVIMVDGGTHFGDGCSRIRSTTNAIKPVDWLQAKNGGVLSSQIPYGFTHEELAEREVIE